MNNNNQQSAISEQHVTDSNAQLVAHRVNHFQKRGYSELEALAIAFNLSMFEKEEKKFKEYVEYVSDLTNGFESTNHIAYNYTTDIEICNQWMEYVDKFCPEYDNMDIILKCILVYDSVQTIDSERLIDRWLKYFASELGVKIKTTIDKDGKKSVYVTGYSK